MKKMQQAIWAICTLISSHGYASPSTLIDITFDNTVTDLPAGAINSYPGLYIDYSKKKHQLLVFDDSLTKKETHSRKIQLPGTVHDVKPFIAYKTKNALHYWYCTKDESMETLRMTATKPDEIKRLSVKVKELPHRFYATAGHHQNITCSYRLSNEKLSAKGSK